MDVLLLVVVAGAAAYLLWPRKKAESTQDLINFREVYPDGVIEMPDFKFRLIVEVEPVNVNLRSYEEQAAVWLGLRGMVNSLNIPCSFLVQTRFLNLKDYLNQYREAAKGYSENIAGYADRLCDWLTKESEGKHQRDRRLYILLKIDANTSGVESGIQTDNPLVNSAIKAMGNVGKSKLPPDELRRLARDELFETAAMVRGSLDGLEISSFVLDRRGVLEMLYQTFNRDMAPHARVREADEQGAFSLFTTSRTPELYERGVRQNARAV